ncbi:calcium channel flower isoform X2 [Ischnura elegans]|uniref:calcium channel flower isoform X2 n=1 Tax=Ischnura elegans TaxID=197161 RepID=UPI001ED87851|nr:calcium channel flower isoform X2 [Ischnura elegans]
MSFMEKIGAMMQRPGEDAQPKDDVPWWMKYAGRGLGTVGGIIAIGLGLWNCFGIILANVWCLLGGIWQMLAGFLVVVVEAPCCCMFIDFVQNISEWVDRKPYFYRAVGYAGIALPGIFMCPGLGSIFGSGLIFGTGVIYGLMSLGKKGSREEMASAAVGGQGVMSPTSQMPPGGGPPAYQQGGMQGDMQHSTLMEDPDVWRPT